MTLGGPHHKTGKLKILVTGGHPGDPEYGCGGTIARLTNLGHDVALVYLNHGEAGIPSRPGIEAGKIRTGEAEEACRILQARPLFAGQTDGMSEVNLARYEDYRRLIHQEKPDLVFTHWPLDHHPDHRINYHLVYDAWLGEGKSFSLYFYEVSNGLDTFQFTPSDYVDITASEGGKRMACFAHASQAPEKFYPLQEEVCRFRGIECGSKYAEAFCRHIQSPDMHLAVIVQDPAWQR